MLTIAAVTLAANPPQPSSPNQPKKDGCQRAYTNTLLLKSPEWVYVYKDRTIRTASGVSHVTHGAKDDAPGQHRFYDFNSNLTLDKKYRYLLGGSASAKTGNFAGGALADHEEYKRLHYEWESGTLPFFAWPTDGDRVTVWGSWIWDCGHFTTKGKVTGERTEFHPLNALVVNRRNSYRAKPGESETNVFISSDGNYAHAEEECALSHHPDPNDPGKYDAGYRACVQAAGHEQQPLEGKYSFFVPAPPKPSPGATLSYRTKSDVKSTPATEKIKVKSNGLSVSVSLKSVSGGKTRRFGRSYFLHWTGAHPSSTPLKITFKQLVINKADPKSPSNTKASPWNLYVDLNGYWKLVNDWAPSLLSVKNGQKITLNGTVKINVPAGRGVSLLMHGRECDEPGGRTVFGEKVPIIKPCPAVLDEPVQFSNDEVGIVLDNYKSAAKALGSHTSVSSAKTKGFPGSGTISFGDGKIGEKAFTLKYVVKPG